MAVQVGLWVDHRKAVIVRVSDKHDTIKQVESNVEKHVRFSGGASSGGSRRAAGEDTRERHFEGELAKYYEEVIAGVGDAEEILIFGPGEAKGELRAQLERAGRGAHIVGVESADKMTDGQIAAKVRARFVH
jgi:hypothetical protein